MVCISARETYLRWTGDQSQCDSPSKNVHASSWWLASKGLVWYIADVRLSMDNSQNINLPRPRLDRAQTDSAAPGKRRQLANLYHGQDRHGNDREHHTRHHIQEATSSLARTATFLKSTPGPDDVRGPSRESDPNPPPQSRPKAQSPPPVGPSRKVGEVDIALEEQKAARRQESVLEAQHLEC